MRKTDFTVWEENVGGNEAVQIPGSIILIIYDTQETAPKALWVNIM